MASYAAWDLLFLDWVANFSHGFLYVLFKEGRTKEGLSVVNEKKTYNQIVLQ